MIRSKIIAAGNNQIVSANQIVNKLAKYMYNHIDGAYKLTKGVNQNDVYTIVLYQIIDPHHLLESNETHEMRLDINITTYQNKIRVNIIEISPEEVTIGCDVFKPEVFKDMNKGYIEVYDRICKRIKKRYEGYDFMF